MRQPRRLLEPNALKWLELMRGQQQSSHFMPLKKQNLGGGVDWFFWNEGCFDNFFCRPCSIDKKIDVHKAYDVSQAFTRISLDHFSGFIAQHIFTKYTRDQSLFVSWKPNGPKGWTSRCNGQRSWFQHAKWHVEMVWRFELPEFLGQSSQKYWLTGSQARHWRLSFWKVYSMPLLVTLLDSAF